jgi:hypothetical protein
MVTEYTVYKNGNLHKAFKAHSKDAAFSLLDTLLYSCEYTSREHKCGVALTDNKGLVAAWLNGYSLTNPDGNLTSDTPEWIRALRTKPSNPVSNRQLAFEIARKADSLRDDIIAITNSLSDLREDCRLASKRESDSNLYTDSIDQAYFWLVEAIDSLHTAGRHVMNSEGRARKAGLASK